MTGTISSIDWELQRGVILGADGKAHRFERENMVFFLQFDKLQPGTFVLFELNAGGGAFNVEQMSPSH